MHLTHSDGTVAVRLFMSLENDSWEQVLEAVDDGVTLDNTPPIVEPGHIGIRTDFMDVEFDDFRIEKL